MNAETASPSPGTYGSPGEAIRKARERAKLSLDELGASTRLSRQVLEALERDAFDQLLEPVYVRGYYRKCAKALGLPDQPLIDAYQAMYTPPPTVAPQRLRLASGGELGESSRLPKSLAVFAPIAAVVVCGVIWVMHTARNSAPPASPVTMLDGQNGVVVETAPLDGAAQAASTIGGAPTAMGNPGETDPTAAGTVTATPTTPAVGTVASPAAGQAVDPAAAAAAAAANDLAAASASTQLTLQFNAISWARVEDGTGKSLLSGVIAAGETRTVDGKPPYSVFLGNAPGVTVQFKGQAMDIKPFMKDNSTARFTVPVTGG